MGSKRKVNHKQSVKLLHELCKDLLQKCESPPETYKFMEYFQSLKNITDKICNLQRDSLVIHSIRRVPRDIQLNNIEHHYKNCFLSQLSIKKSEGAGFGLYANEVIQQASMILCIHAKDMLSLSNLSTPFPSLVLQDPLFSAMDNVALSFATLHELSLGEKSKFMKYITSLPSAYSTVAFLTSNDFAVIDGFPAAESSLNAYRNICRQYAYFYLLFDRIKSETALPNYMKSFCFEDYQWAVSTVMSRNNMIPGSEGGLLCLIPIWDMINHKQMQVTTNFDPESQCLQFFAMESYQPGDEIFMDYGNRTSTDFLLYSGFVPEINKFHKVPVKLGLSKFDRLSALRAKVLEKLNLSSEISVSISSQNGSFPPANLTAFARVFVMSKDELEAVLRSDDSVKNLLSNQLSSNRIDSETRKFIEGRLNLLIRGYESRLNKNIQSVQARGPLHDHCVRLCRQDIATLSQCLESFTQ